jgi:hypothetical protein
MQEHEVVGRLHCISRLARKCIEAGKYLGELDSRSQDMPWDGDVLGAERRSPNSGPRRVSIARGRPSSSFVLTFGLAAELKNSFSPTAKKHFPGRIRRSRRPDTDRMPSPRGHIDFAVPTE